jgi:hypothetical protein
VLTSPVYFLSGYTDFTPLVTDVPAVLQLYLQGNEITRGMDAEKIALVGLVLNGHASAPVR